MKVTWLAAGHCLNVEALTRRGAPWRTQQYPAGFALLEHPTRGPVLFDTGYHPRFHDVTRQYPARAYAVITPVRVTPDETAAAQLGRLGIDPRDVREVLLSHFHADHVAGLRDFPAAQLRFDARAYDAVRPLRGVQAVRSAYLSALLPEDFASRACPWTAGAWQPAPPDLAPFDRAVDVFGDGSAWAVALPGHAHGQVGLVVHATRGLVLLAADSAWSTRSLRDGGAPPLLARQVFADQAAERDSFHRVRLFMDLNPHATVLPSHCLDALTLHGGPR